MGKTYIEIKSWHAVLIVGLLVVAYLAYKAVKTVYCQFRGASCGASKIACDASNMIPTNWGNQRNCLKEQKDCEGSCRQ